MSNSPYHSRPCSLLIRNQGVIEKFEHSRPESRKIETVTSFGVAQRHILSRVLMRVLDYPSPASCNFFLDISAAELPRYNKLFSRIKTENSNSTKCDISLSANGVVCHIGVCEVTVSIFLAFWPILFKLFNDTFISD